MKMPSSELLADLLVHLSRQVAQSPGSTLSSAQWSALRFFAHANRFSRQPSAFAGYHGTTRGTASQTVKSLVHLGYLEKHPGQNDGRSVTFTVTETGATMLEADPQRSLVHALDTLSPEKKQLLSQTLAAIDASLTATGAGKNHNFGSCTQCRYYKADQADATKADTCHYGCEVALIDKQEVGQLCCRFSPETG